MEQKKEMHDLFEKNPFMHAIETHFFQILIGIVVLFGIAGFISVSLSGQSSREEEAQYQFSKLLEQYQSNETDLQNWQESDENAKLLSDLEAELDTFSVENKDLYFAQEAAYLSAKLTFMKGDYDKAKAKFNDYIKSVKTPLQKQKGHFSMGKVYESIAFNGDKALYNDAIEEYDTLTRKYSDSKPMYWAALLAKGNCYFYQNDYVKAKESYEKLLSEKSNQNENVAFFKEAQDKCDNIDRIQAISK